MLACPLGGEKEGKVGAPPIYPPRASIPRSFLATSFSSSLREGKKHRSPPEQSLIFMKATRRETNADLLLRRDKVVSD